MFENNLEIKNHLLKNLRPDCLNIRLELSNLLSLASQEEPAQIQDKQNKRIEFAKRKIINGLDRKGMSCEGLYEFLDHNNENLLEIKVITDWLEKCD